MFSRKLRLNSIALLMIAVFMLLFGNLGANAETLPYEDTVSVEPSAVSETASASTFDEVLPSASPHDVVMPHAVGLTEDKDEPKLFWGFVMWILVGVIIAVMLAVILTTKTKAYRGGGKNRYSSGNKMGGQRHLLNDKYYHNGKRK